MEMGLQPQRASRQLEGILDAVCLDPPAAPHGVTLPHHLTLTLTHTLTLTVTTRLSP